MSTFNEFKNQTEILKKYMQKMYAITECDIKPQWIQQNFLKENNPHIFLQLLHYMIIKFSPSVIFVKILDYYPTIKDDNDKKFLTNAMAFGRKLFSMDTKIDVDQFLSQKFVQKKTEWLSQFSKAIYEWHVKQSKSGIESKSVSSNYISKKESELSSANVPSKLPTSSKFKKQDDDSEDQMPRDLNIAPSKTKRPIISNQRLQDSSSDEDLKQLMTKKKELGKMKQRTVKNPVNATKSSSFRGGEVADQNGNRGNMYPKNIEREEEESTYQNQFISTLSNQNKIQKPLPKSTNTAKPFSQQKQAQQSQPYYEQSQLSVHDYVTREEFMQIVTDMTRNFTQLLSKFNDFQSQVGGWVQNVNAKISILQENVKTIKNNL